MTDPITPKTNNFLPQSPLSSYNQTSSTPTSTSSTCKLWKIIALIMCLIALITGTYLLLSAHIATLSHKIVTTPQPNTQTPQIHDQSQSFINNCSDAQQITNKLIYATQLWQAQELMPVEDITSTHVPLFIKNNTPAYLGYRSNTLQILTLKGKPENLKEDLVIKAFSNLTADLKKSGYSLVNEDNSSSANNQLVSQVIDLPTVNLNYTYQKDQQLFGLRIVNDSNNNDYNLTAEYYCAPDINQEKQTYNQLIAVNNLIDFTDPYTTLEIWGIYDQVIHLSVGSLASGGSMSHYIASINGQLVDLYTGQDYPQCHIFNQHHVGKGLQCYDDNTGEQLEVSY